MYISCVLRLLVYLSSRLRVSMKDDPTPSVVPPSGMMRADNEPYEDSENVSAYYMQDISLVYPVLQPIQIPSEFANSATSANVNVSAGLSS